MENVIRVLFLTFLGLGTSCGNNELCTLTWADFSVGHSIPENAVWSNPGTGIVARVLIPNSSRYYLGQLNVTGGKLEIPYNTSPYTSFSGEILLNANNCSLTWVATSEDDLVKYAIPNSEATRQGYVGRTGKDGMFLAGEVSMNFNTLRVMDNGVVRTISNVDDIYILHSRPGKLQIRIFDVTFLDESSDGLNEILGMDEFINNADTSIVQTVVHSKLVHESYRFVSSASFFLDFSAMVGVCIPFYCWTWDWDTSDIIKGPTEQSSFLDIRHGQNKDFKFSREVSIPPFSTLQVCSLLNVVSVDTDWEGTMEVSQPGWSSSDLLTFMSNRTQGIDWTEVDDTIQGKVSGRFTGSANSASRFVLSQTDGGLCSQIEAYLKCQSALDPSARNAKLENERIRQILGFGKQKGHVQ